MLLPANRVMLPKQTAGVEYRAGGGKYAAVLAERVIRYALAAVLLRGAPQIEVKRCVASLPERRGECATSTGGLDSS